jgi:hypothetical protein
MVELARYGPSDNGPRYAGDGWYPLSYGYEVPDGFVRVSVRDESPDRLVAMLAGECVKSVSYRYPSDTPDTLPGPIDRYYTDPERLTFERPRKVATIGEAINLVNGYEYQSCEHPDWRKSEAREFVIALLDALVSCLPEVQKAETWAWDES